MPMRPTPSPSQRICLRLAASEPIAYYKGGTYSTALHLGTNQREWIRHPLQDVPTTTPQTINACMLRGWLTSNCDSDEGATNIYARRWTITPAGRAAIDEQTKKRP